MPIKVAAALSVWFVLARAAMSVLGRRYGMHLSSIKRVKLRVDQPDSPAAARRL